VVLGGVSVQTPYFPEFDETTYGCAWAAPGEDT